MDPPAPAAGIQAKKRPAGDEEASETDSSAVQPESKKPKPDESKFTL